MNNDAEYKIPVLIHPIIVRMRNNGAALSVMVPKGHSWKHAAKVTFKWPSDYASGDRDPNDKSNGTFDSLFGARSWEFGPKRICGPWYRSNINSPAGSVEVNPLKTVTLVSGVRWVWLAQARDQWVGSKLRDITGNSGTYLGSEFEIRLRGNVSKYFKPEVGYARIFKGSYLERVPRSPGARDSNYFYVDFSFFYSRQK